MLKEKYYIAYDGKNPGLGILVTDEDHPDLYLTKEDAYKVLKQKIQNNIINSKDLWYDFLDEANDLSAYCEKLDKSINKQQKIISFINNLLGEEKEFLQKEFNLTTNISNKYPKIAKFGEYILIEEGIFPFGNLLLRLGEENAATIDRDIGKLKIILKKATAFVSFDGKYNDFFDGSVLYYQFSTVDKVKTFLHRKGLIKNIYC